MKRTTKKLCPSFKPYSELPYSQNYNIPSCSHCAYFSTRNCHQSSADNLDDDNFII